MRAYENEEHTLLAKFNDREVCSSTEGVVLLDRQNNISRNVLDPFVINATENSSKNVFAEGEEVSFYIFSGESCLFPDNNIQELTGHDGGLAEKYFTLSVSSNKVVKVFFDDAKHGYSINVLFSFEEI